MRHSVAAPFVLLTVLALAISGTAAEVPVVAAVDSSRSLSTHDLEIIRAAVTDLVDRLPPGTPSGLLTFDDEARWVVPPGGSRANLLEALADLAPRGDFTVLNDALFSAARELEGGGVVVVVTDGRDENSATTPEDVARMCESHRVRLVVAGLGRRHDSRALRRLALITRGELVERLALAPGEVLPAVERAREGVAEDLAAAAPQPPQPLADQVPAESTPAVATPAWVLPVMVVLSVLGLGLVVALWLALRRREPERQACDRCGALLEPWETSCSRCQIAELEEAVRTQQVAAPAIAVESEEEVALDPEVFRKSPLPEGLANTLVLDEEPVLIARQRGKSARTYHLPKDRVFAVGRAPDVNSLQIDDPTVSAQHLRLVPKDGEFYLVDLDTTNGTMVNHERVKVRKLASGDVIQVGAVQLEFALQLRRLS